VRSVVGLARGFATSVAFPAFLLTVARGACAVWCSDVSASLLLAKLIFTRICEDQEMQKKRLVKSIDALLSAPFPMHTEEAGKLQLLGSQVAERLIACSPLNRVKTICCGFQSSPTPSRTLAAHSRVVDPFCSFPKSGEPAHCHSCVGWVAP
jgi:hypothetical protein